MPGDRPAYDDRESWAVVNWSGIFPDLGGFGAGMGEGDLGAGFTERMVPEEAHARIFREHVARYRFAKDFVRGKRALDIACGEGYGAAALAKAGASKVVGIDISPEACDHARSKYGVDARPGSAEAIPLPDRSVDVVVSFETIEHVDSPPAFLDECARVLEADGLMIVSTPNRPVHGGEGSGNPYHQVEFDEGEFLGLLRSKFREVRLYSQSPRSAAWWSARSLAAERSPWLRIKGYWRVSTWLCPAIRPVVSPAIRERVVDLILGRDTPLGSLLDPYIVRERSERSREQPYFLIAVARGVKAD